MADERTTAANARDWHEYECANGHHWWSAPTSGRCPVCGTTTYTPLRIERGTTAPGGSS